MLILLATPIKVKMTFHPCHFIRVNLFALWPRNHRNHWAIGAKVSVEIAGRTLTRWITAGTSYLGQEPAEAFFGLGSADRADRVIITWPDGGESILPSVPAGQGKTVLYGEVFNDGFESGELSSWTLSLP